MADERVRAQEASIDETLIEQPPIRDDARVPVERRSGRGAASNASGRYEPHSRERFDDGWELEEDAPSLRTEVTVDASRSIIARNASPDVPFDRSVNPYRGCEHGCVYCFARPTHAFLGLSPGLDFETKILAKPQAAALLRAALGRRGYKVSPIAIGTNTDPYQPIERQWRIMRQVLEVLAEHRHPVTIVTKGALIARDADILGEMARDGLARAALSVTTLDRKLARKMEPRASTPAKRLETIARLAEAGVPVGVMAAPIIPAVNDAEIETILQAAKTAGARWAEYVLLRLLLEVSPLFQEWLAEQFPDRAARVMKLVRETQGGRDYDPQWGKRMRGEGVYAGLITRRFTAARRRLGLEAPALKLRTDLFRPPAAGGQLALGL